MYKPKCKSAVLLVGLIVLGALVALDAYVALAPKATGHDVQVYSAILGSALQDGTRTVVIQQQTENLGDPSGQFDDKEWSVIQDRITRDRKYASIPDLKALILELRKRNRRSSDIPQFGPRGRIVLVSSKQLEQLFADKAWDGFYEKYPHSDGLETFSLPVFSQDGSYACVYHSHTSGGLAGLGSLVVLKRSGDRWKAVADIMLWVS